MKTILSPSLHARFHLLRAQRKDFVPTIEGVGKESLWRRPTDAEWAVGDTLVHLCKTMQVYRLLIGVSLPVLFPVAWLFRNQPFQGDSVDIFAAHRAAGKRMRATWLLVPHRPARLPSTHELWERLELETRRLEDMVAGMAEEVAGHFRIFDPGVGSPNLIQRVQLLAFHERHHFKIIEHLISGEVALEGDVRNVLQMSRG